MLQHFGGKFKVSMGVGISLWQLLETMLVSICGWGMGVGNFAAATLLETMLGSICGWGDFVAATLLGAILVSVLGL